MYVCMYVCTYLVSVEFLGGALLPIGREHEIVL